MDLIVISCIVTSLSICLNGYLILTKQKTTTKIKFLKDFSKDKSIVLSFWKTSYNEILNNLHSIQAANGFKNKYRDSLKDLKLLNYEIVLLTEKENPLEVERALGYLTDRLQPNHLTLLTISRKNMPRDNNNWNIARRMTNKLISKINSTN